MSNLSKQKGLVVDGNIAIKNTQIPSKVSQLVPKLASRIIDLVRKEGFETGFKLSEPFLCDLFNVSRSPIRKALQYLQSAGVVVSIPNKGFQLIKSADQLAGMDLSAPQLSDEDLYLQVANDRFSGDLKTEINEVALMERYKITRKQVQNILNRMAQENMVDKKPGGRGWVFRPLLTSKESYVESYRYRMIIEPAAILEPGYQVDLVELEKCRREQESLLKGGIEKCTALELYNAGVHLHETIIAGAKSQILLDSLKRLNQMRRVLEYGTRLDRSRLYRQCEEHLLLIDLLVKGERMEASNFLRQHLNGARITKVDEQS